MRFVINKGKIFECEFVIKQPGASVPLDINGATGTFTLSTIGHNSCVALEEIDLTIADELAGQNGKFTLTLSALQTSTLNGAKAFAEDGYPLIATYSGTLDITHPEEGKIFVDILKIYVRDSGIACTN